MMSTCARNMYRYEIKLTVKQILCINMVKYWDKYTAMHGQQKVKNYSFGWYKLNSVALVRTRTIPTERPPPVGEASANFCG